MMQISKKLMKDLSRARYNKGTVVKVKPNMQDHKAFRLTKDSR